MKKKTLAVLGAAALVGVALASCSEKKKDPEGEKWEVGGEVDLWHVYSKSYGTTYNGVITNGKTTNPIDGLKYTSGDQLPAWKEFQKKLGLKRINQAGNYGEDDATNYSSFTAAKEDEGVFRDKNGNVTDLFYNTTANLNELGDSGQLIDLTKYIEAGKMPYFKAYLDENPAIKDEITHNGKIFYTPYLDGYQAIERNYMMDTRQVEKLLDDDITGLGVLQAGQGGNAKGLKSAPQAEPFIDANYNYPDATTQIDIVNPSNGEKVTVTVNQTQNILKQQNTLLAAGTTGAALIQQFKDYADAAYGNIITTYYDGDYSKIFTSVGACYNADDLVALLRIFKACPDVLYGNATAYDEVVPVFPRGQANNRIENILNFGATLYGVQGRGSEYDHLFFGADGKIHDFDTQTASYDMLDKLHALYAEGLIQDNFWNGSSGTGGLDRFFKKTADKPTFGLMEYDYIATQSAANEFYKGVGTKAEARATAECGYDFSDTDVEVVDGVNAILSPITYVSTESYTWNQSLDNKTGKTLQRYYEENRSVKNTSWSIPKGSDNIAAAITLMDYMFSTEGWEIQNFGPKDYWDYGTVLGEENTPVIKETVLNHFAETALDFWNYCRGFIGTTHGIGHYRPSTLDMQATNYHTQQSYTNLALACSTGVQTFSKAKTEGFDWKTSMPMAVFSKLSKEVSNTYIGVTTFWGQDGKKSSSTVGWVAIVANGSDYAGDVLTSVNSRNYTYTQVKSEITTKNQNYLYAMGEKMNLIADEARQA
ncbi:MAG: hypothetical protein IJM36_00415 [Acholeplasmatales bacterium]|nr:hypothetical protein [Acholeplasmatales bacterium]